MINTSDLKSVSLVEIARILNGKSSFDDIVVFNVNAFTAGNSYGYYPLRIDALAIIQCVSGETKIKVDLKEYTIKKNSLIIIHPRNFLENTITSEDFKANMVMVSKSIVEDVIPRLTDIAPLLVQQRSDPHIELSEDEAERFTSFYRFLSERLNSPHTPFYRNKVVSILQGMFYEVMDFSYTRNSIEVRRKSRKQEILAKFILAVSEHFRDERQVSYYAEKICVSPKHLSAVIKDLTGKTAGDWIEIYVTMEAKMLLRSSDLTIQEISNKLNFTNQSFFGKYFKHQTGFSPSEYRSKTD